MEATRRVKDVQRLNRCITALGRFISRLGERALPFFKLLKKLGPVQWTPKAEEALQSLKSYLALRPILVAPVDKEPLLLYIAATNQVVTVVLVVEHDAPTDKSKGKRSRNTLLGHPSKKRMPGIDGSKDPSPDELTCAAEDAAEEASLGLSRPKKNLQVWPSLPKARQPARCSTRSTSSAPCCATPGSGTR